MTSLDKLMIQAVHDYHKIHPLECSEAEAELAQLRAKLAAADRVIKAVPFGCTKDTDFIAALEEYEHLKGDG